MRTAGFLLRSRIFQLEMIISNRDNVRERRIKDKMFCLPQPVTNGREHMS